jgi:hypothetical protein
MLLLLKRQILPYIEKLVLRLLVPLLVAVD